MALLLDLSSVLLAQAAGLLASTIPRDWLKSVILAELFAFGFLLMLLWAHGWVLDHAAQMPFAAGTMVGWGSPVRGLYHYHSGMLGRVGDLIEFATNGSFGDFHSSFGFGYNSDGAPWQDFRANLSAGGQEFWWHGTLGIFCGAFLLLLGAVRLAARRVESSWRDGPGTESVS